MADGVQNSNTTRAMGLVPVNALKVTSVVGQGPDFDDEFRVTRHSKRLGKTSGGQQANDHRGSSSNQTQINRRVND